MLSLFRRRKGRHQLGAAVTSIPALAPAVPAPVHASAPVPVAVPAAAPVAAEPRPAAPPPTAPVTPEPVLAPGPRVELGFRDGSRASLDPSSDQARALEDIAAVLTRKD